VCGFPDLNNKNLKDKGIRSGEQVPSKRSGDPVLRGLWHGEFLATIAVKTVFSNNPKDVNNKAHEVDNELNKNINFVNTSSRQYT
jgi:hypothetical protein